VVPWLVVAKVTSKQQVPPEDRGERKASLQKTAGLAAALGLATWLLVPYLLPVKAPADFPALPDLRGANQGLREALQSADKEARRRPGSAEAVGKLGLAYHANQFPEQASRAYRIATRLAPGDYHWVYCQAALQEENGNAEEQLALLQQTLRLKPDHVPALVKLADSYFKLDKLDQAAHYYDVAAKVPHGGAILQATFGLGRVAARRQQWSKVIAHIKPLSSTYSYVMPPYELLQEAYVALGQADQAAGARQSMALAKWKVMPPPEDSLNEQLVTLSYSSTRLLKQAGLLGRLGYPDRAMQVARRAVQADPSDPEIRNFMARTLLTFYADQPEAIDQALTQLSECLRLRPGDLAPLWSFSDDFFKTPKTAAAVARLSTLLRPHADLADAHFYLGLVADAQGETAEAVAQYQAALKHTPNESAVYNKLGQILVKAGKVDEAIAHFQKSVQLNSLNAGARLNLGIGLMQRGNYGQAVKEFSELLRLNPHDAATHFSLGFALLYSKRTDEAMAKFREGLRYKPADAEAHYGLASALSIQRKRDEAVVELREALRLRPDFPAAQELLHQLDR
jgi:tetratricopeptide (TPR) repeat protein